MTTSNITAASTWLHAMGDAAQSLGVTIQYCMPLINHMLESTTIPAVTNARASGDYHPGSDQWDIGLSSIFYAAIGIQPSKDDWWSTEFQPGSPYGDKPTEPNWQLQAIITTMSTGPVGPSDMIQNGTNASVVMQTCRAGDGLLLRPDRPMVTVDSAFVAAVWGGNGWAPSPATHAPDTTGEGTVVVNAPYVGDVTVPDVLLTHSAHAHGAYRWYYLLTVRLPGDYALPFSDLGSQAGSGAAGYVAVDWFNPKAGGSAPFNASSPSLVIPKGQGQPSAPTNAHTLRFWVLAPVLPGGWVLMGEFAKIAVMSHQRTGGLVLLPGGAGFNATVHTAQAETSVTYLVSAPAALREGLRAAGAEVDLATGVMEVVCTTANGKDATLSCTGAGCTCA